MEHPTNRLYHGKCVDLYDALITFIAAMEYEDMLDARCGNSLGLSFAKDIAEAQRLRAEYRAAVDALVADWKQRGGLAAMFAEAEEAGDYSGLAI